MPCKDGPFQVLECINDNTYKIDLPGQFGVSTTFNVGDLSPFDVGDDYDSSTNPSQKGEDDVNQSKSIIIFQGPITKSRANKLQQALIAHIQATVTYMLCKVELQDEDEDALNAF